MDLRTTIEPKSDQLNSDDLIGGEKILTITKVTGGENDQQPVSIYYKGDNGKPYKPCKTMRRLMVQIWGYDGTKYVGKSMKVYRDDSVKWAGVEVGGIRISEMSDIQQPTKALVTVAKGKRKPVTINPLQQPKKEVLTKDHKHFDYCKKGVDEGQTTVEKLQEKYEISDEVKELLNDKTQEND